MDILSLLIFLLPPYVANSSPVLLGGGVALDFDGKFFDGERVFGEGKTLRGFVGGIVCGSLVSALICLIGYQLPFFSDLNMQFLAGFMLSFGTLFGDALGSFIKRRLKIGSGKPFLLDTFLFIVSALLFALPFTGSALYTIENLLFIVFLTMILHPLTNIFANRVGLKKVPW